MRVLGIILELAFGDRCSVVTNIVRTKKLVNCIFLGCCKLNVSLCKGYGNGLGDDTGLSLRGGTDVR